VLLESLPDFATSLVTLGELSPRWDDSLEPGKWSKRTKTSYLLIITYIFLSCRYMVKVDEEKVVTTNVPGIGGG